MGSLTHPGMDLILWGVETSTDPTALCFQWSFDLDIFTVGFCNSAESEQRDVREEHFLGRRVAAGSLWHCLSEFKAPGVVPVPKHWRAARVEQDILLQPPLSVDLPWPMFGPEASLEMLSLSERAGSLCSHIWSPTFLSFSGPFVIISKTLLDLQHKSH